MITVKFTRTKDGVFVPHVDVMRSLNRTFRRAGIDVKYSCGFSHHMALKLTQPLPFGVADLDGYATTEIVGDFDCKRVCELLSRAAPDYISICGAYVTDKSPNLAGIVNASLYRVNGHLTAEQIDRINSLPDGYEVTARKNDAEKKSVGDMIYGIKADGEGFDALLAFGNKNLRIDLLLAQFNADFGTEFDVTDAVRRTQYLKSEEKFLSAEEFLDTVCREKYISRQ